MYGNFYTVHQPGMQHLQSSCSTEQTIRGVAHESQDYHGLYRMQATEL